MYRNALLIPVRSDLPDNQIQELKLFSMIRRLRMKSCVSGKDPGLDVCSGSAGTVRTQRTPAGCRKAREAEYECNIDYETDERKEAVQR